MFRNMGFNPYKLEKSSLDDVKSKFKELKQKRDELKEVQSNFYVSSYLTKLGSTINRCYIFMLTALRPLYMETIVKLAPKLSI